MENPTGGNELITVDILSKAGVQAGMKVADLGCGNLGYFAIPAAKMVGKDGISYAVDILKSVLEAVEGRAKMQGLSNLKTVWSNLEMLGATAIEEASLDIAFLINMIFQSDKDDIVVKEACRLVKSGGKVAVVDWLKIATPFGPPALDRSNPEDIKRFAAAAGLKLEEEFSAGPYHYGLLFSK